MFVQLVLKILGGVHVYHFCGRDGTLLNGMRGAVHIGDRAVGKAERGWNVILLSLCVHLHSPDPILTLRHASNVKKFSRNILERAIHIKGGYETFPYFIYLTRQLTFISGSSVIIILYRDNCTVQSFKERIAFFYFVLQID